MSEIHQKTVDAILHELGSRRMLDDIDDDLHQEIGEAVAVVAGVPALIALIARAETAEKRLAECEQGVRSAIKRTAELLFDAFDITVAEEREACARIAETVAAHGLHASMWESKFKAVATAIRSLPLTNETDVEK